MLTPRRAKMPAQPATLLCCGVREMSRKARVEHFATCSRPECVARAAFYRLVCERVETLLQQESTSANHEERGR